MYAFCINVPLHSMGADYVSFFQRNLAQTRDSPWECFGIMFWRNISWCHKLAILQLLVQLDDHPGCSVLFNVTCHLSLLQWLLLLPYDSHPRHWPDPSRPSLRSHSTHCDIGFNTSLDRGKARYLCVHRSALQSQELLFGACAYCTGQRVSEGACYNGEDVVAVTCWILTHIKDIFHLNVYRFHCSLWCQWIHVLS